MFKHFRTRIILAGLLLTVGMTLGCDGKSPSAPSRTAPTQRPTVTSLYPKIGGTVGSTLVIIDGMGFESGATVTLDGATTNTTVKSSRQIVAETPAHAAGAVDVVVTNPDGQSGKLAGGFTYAVFTLTVSPNPVTAGGELSMSWVAPAGGSGDWVALFKVGDPNTRPVWLGYTESATSGTFTLDAPAEAGQYEFRYLVDDEFIDVARSSPVTVN
jgi:hypothetical protein